MQNAEIELSIVIPCLNEAETIETCVQKAKASLDQLGVSGEVIVADNGSTDGSQAIAERVGARIIAVMEKGYGNALMGGIAAARGKFILMGDADDSYDFMECSKFLTKLREGFDLVQGCRLPSGGGQILPGAMPFLHRWWGNPMFSWMARKWFHAPINDVYCGMRGFTRQHYATLNQRCTGMEFATEMIIKSSLYHAKIAEVPITLHPDGRKTNAPHLKTFRDGWRTIRFFLLYSPRWLFLYPGLAIMIIGSAGALRLVLGPVAIGKVVLDFYSLIYMGAAIVIGFQAVVFAFFTKIFASSEGLLPRDPKFEKVYKWVNLEVGLAVGTVLILGGIVGSLAALVLWGEHSFRSQAPPATTLRLIAPSVTCLILGGQIILSSFFASILGLNKK